MKFIVFIALSFVTISIATPLSPLLRSQRQANSECSNQSNLVSVLEQVGNLLSNLLNNLPILHELGLTGPNNLLDLTELLVALGGLLSDLLGSGLNGSTQGIVDVLNNIISTLNNALGGNQGSQWACDSGSGSTGTDVGNLVRAIHLNPGVPNLVVGLVKLLINLLGSLLKALGVPIP